MCIADTYPQMSTFPELSKPYINTANGHVEFRCHVPFPAGDPDVGLQITWTMDDQEMVDPATGHAVETVLVGDQRTAILDERFLTGNLGKTVSLS
jgi:hypothetical protein